MKKNSILVLMSTYNGERYIKDQLKSIIEQKTDFNIDILIRDDGSKDGTVQIIENIQKEYVYTNIRLQTGENIGCNASFFELIKSSDEYEYYAISDQDDIWLPDKIDRAINEISIFSSDQPILYGTTSYIVNKDLIIKGITQKKRQEISFFNTII